MNGTMSLKQLSPGTDEFQTCADGIIVFSMAWRRRIRITLFRYPTCQVVAVFGRHLHSSCSFRHTVWQPIIVNLAVARFLLQPQHIACPCPVITIYRNLSPTAKDSPISTVISRHHHHLTLLTMLSRTLWNGYCYSSHVKNLWLIDWLIDWKQC